MKQVATLLVLVLIPGVESTQCEGSFHEQKGFDVNSTVNYPPFPIQVVASMLGCAIFCQRHLCCLSAVHDGNECRMYDLSFAEYLEPKASATFLSKPWDSGKTARFLTSNLYSDFCFSDREFSPCPYWWNFRIGVSWHRHFRCQQRRVLCCVMHWSRRNSFSWLQILYQHMLL
jgi:hypothetical protein